MAEKLSTAGLVVSGFAACAFGPYLPQQDGIMLMSVAGFFMICLLGSVVLKNP